MRETETQVTTVFASPAWLGGAFKHRQLESRGLRWLYKSSHLSLDSLDKSFSFPSAESQVLLAHWEAKAARHGMANGVTTSRAAPALPWVKLSVINPLLGLDNLQQAFKPLPSSFCLNHHSLKCSNWGCWWQMVCSDSCTAVQSHQPALIRSSASPSHPTRAFIFLKHREGHREKKFKNVGNSSTSSLHLQCYNARLAICRARSNSWSYSEKAAISLAWLWYSSPVSHQPGLRDSNKMQGWILLHTSGILQFGENLTFTEKNKNRIPGFRTITENKSHRPLFQTSQGFVSSDSTLCEVSHNRVVNQSAKYTIKIISQSIRKNKLKKNLSTSMWWCLNLL